MATVLLTLEDVDGWREELRRLSEQQSDLNRRVTELQKKLADAQPFVAVAAAQRIQASAANAAQTNFPILHGVVLPPASMFDAITQLLRKQCGALEPKDIAKAIKDDDSLSDKIRNSHPNYLYTALMRMTKRGMLVKDSQGRYSAPKTNEAA